MKLFILSSFFFVLGCSTHRNKEAIDNIYKQYNSKSNFLYKDESGDFILQQETGFLVKNNQVFTKKQLLNNLNDDKKYLERSITISKIGQVGRGNKKVKILMPEKSQHTAYLEGKRFFTEITLDRSKKKLFINSQGPLKEFNRDMQIDLINNNKIYCFLSQVIECARVNNFFELVQEKGLGEMNFLLVIDSYPLIVGQFKNIPNKPILNAVLSYEGKSKAGNLQFSLQLAGQSIVYHVNPDGKIEKYFWVAQGISAQKTN